MKRTYTARVTDAYGRHDLEVAGQHPAEITVDPR